MREGLKDTRGQMTVELAVVLPVVMVIAVIATNAVHFFALCSLFDRTAHQSIRVYAASPAYGSDALQCCSQIEQSLRNTFAENDNVFIQVSYEAYGVDLQEFTATIHYAPTLFGLKLTDRVFGVALPQLTHMTRFVVDSYRPGIFI